MRVSEVGHNIRDIQRSNSSIHGTISAQRDALRCVADWLLFEIPIIKLTTYAVALRLAWVAIGPTDVNVDINEKLYV